MVYTIRATKDLLNSKGKKLHYPNKVIAKKKKKLLIAYSKGQKLMTKV